MSEFSDIATFTKIRPGENVSMEVARGGETRRLDLTIGKVTERDRFGNSYEVGRIGIGPGARVIERVGIMEAPLVGIRQTVRIVSFTFETLGQIITGRRSVKELGGPLKIAQVSGQSLALGPLELVTLIALISINLGFINLLPVPVLDGGHLLLYAIEAVRRRPVEPQVVEWAFRGGMAVILALMIFVTLNDLGSFGVWKNLAGLIG